MRNLIGSPSFIIIGEGSIFWLKKKKEIKASLEDHAKKERTFILDIVVIFLISVEKMLSKTANFASILSVREQIIEAQQGDIYNGELEGDVECRKR